MGALVREELRSVFLPSNFSHDKGLGVSALIFISCSQ